MQYHINKKKIDLGRFKLVELVDRVIAHKLTQPLP